MQEIPILLAPATETLSYPLAATVPLPKEWEKDTANLRLLENDKVIIADILDVWKWNDGSIRWLHVIANFNWDGGQPRQYKLVKSNDPVPESDMALCLSSDQIIINTGLNKIQIDNPFRGFFIDDSVNEYEGIHLTDELEIEWDARHDDTETVLEVVSAGKAHATIKVSGWLQNPEKRVRPFIKYTTFITAYHHSPVVKVDHACTFADDMRKHGVRSLSFTFPENSNHVFARSVNEKVPNVLYNKTFYQWPGSYVPFAQSDVVVEEVYKFKYLQKGPILQNSLPNEYRQAFDMQTDTDECEPQYIAASSLEGVSMRNELMLLLTDDNVNSYSDMYLNEQIPSPAKSFMCDSFAWDLLASEESDYPDQEKSVRDGQLGQYNSIERYNDVGWNIYGNIPSHELMEESRPSLHRIWFNCHYMHICTIWETWLRTRDQEALRIARIATDNYCSIALTRYDSVQGYDYGDFTHRDDVPSCKNHYPGALWHCKAFIPWGGRGWGMDQMDSDADNKGHWIDPHSMLLAWLIDRDHWALDGYEIWFKARDDEGWVYKTSYFRETISTIVNNIRAYEWLPSTVNYKAIEEMVEYCMNLGPLENQTPGPMWEPTWIRRAVHFFPDNVQLKQYVLDSMQADLIKWWPDISACAYELTQNLDYITKFSGPFYFNGKYRVFHDETGKWEGYGFGAFDSRRWNLEWGRFLRVIRDAGITMGELPDAGNYPLGHSRWNHQSDAKLRGTKVLVHKNTVETVPINIDMQVLGGGDIDATGLWCYAPDNTLLWYEDRLQVSTTSRVRGHRETGWFVYVEPQYEINDPQTGLFTLAFGCNEGQLYIPVNSGGKDECMVLQNINVEGWSEPVHYNLMFCEVFLLALTDQPVTITFWAHNHIYPSYVSLKEVDGDFTWEKWLVSGESVSITVASDRLKLRIVGHDFSYTQMQLVSQDNTEDIYLCGENLDTLFRIKNLIGG